MKTYTLKEVTDKFIGETGTLKRDDFENKLEIEFAKYRQCVKTHSSAPLQETLTYK